MTTPARLDHERVLTVARKAITERLGYWQPDAIIAIRRIPEAPGGYRLHVNSGGNYIAAASAFRAAGYEVMDPPLMYEGDRSRAYGQRLIIRLPEWALNEVTAKLRLHEWEPPTVYACECGPQWLCPAHAEIRAVDHYGATG